MKNAVGKIATKESEDDGVCGVTSAAGGIGLSALFDSWRRPSNDGAALSLRRVYAYWPGRIVDTTRWWSLPCPRMNFHDGARLRAAALVFAVGLAACQEDTRPSPLDGAVPNEGARDATMPLDALASLDAVVLPDSSPPDPLVGDASGDGGLLDVCRAVRTWTFESALVERTGQAYRAPDGFVLGSYAGSGPTFLFLGDGEPRTALISMTSEEVGSVFRSVPIGKDRAHAGALLFQYGNDGNGADTAEAQVWSADGMTQGTTHVLGPIYRRGTMQIAAASSLDGQRALLTTGHVAVQPPVGFLVDGEGARVGGVIEFSLEAGELRIPECLMATPTAHGVALSVLDGSTYKWRFKELAANGSVVQDVTYQFDTSRPPSSCSPISPTPTGFIAAFEVGNGSIQLLKLAGGQVASRTVSADGHTLPRWLGETTTGNLLWLDAPAIADNVARWPVSLLFADGGWRTIDQDVGTPQVVASEVGHLYVLQAANSTTRSVEELRCRGVDLAL